MKQIHNSILTVLLVVLSCNIICGQIKETVQAVPANDFLNSIGVNSAINARGEKISNTLECAKYLGFRWIRAGAPDGSFVRPTHYRWLFEQNRVKFGMLVGSGFKGSSSDLKNWLEAVKTVESLGDGIIIAIEGPNEPNNWPVTYNGEKGGGNAVGDSWAALARFQRDLYAYTKADPVLGYLPVWSATDMGAATQNVGLHFLQIPEGAEGVNSEFPAGTKFADVANVHNYFGPAGNYSSNQTWRTASVSGSNSLWANFGETWRNKYKGYTLEELENTPRVTTETGTTIDPYGIDVTEKYQGLVYLSCYLSQYKRNFKYTSIYILRDRSDEAGNQTFGFYKTDYTPRLSAHYLHNMTTVLSDTISTTSPKELTYTISPSRPETVHELLLQKEDGTLMLVVWSEKYARAAKADTITLTFDETYSKINVYNPAQYESSDPTIGERPIATYSNVNSVTLAMTNHPFIVEIDPVRPAGIETPEYSKETSVYPNPVENVFYVQGPSEVKKIEILDFSGRNVLTVSNLNRENPIDLTNLLKGSYVVKIVTKDNIVENHKIIKL